ncbi:ABC transporter ATP-binding protein [Micromonospora cathayae]|uniref:ABC transporter ATP-binding protein n=1 Tax=Micromonospora cathayae TaxID=3028804 RepID=A0ABY7ZLI8_9ACTN|nr:ABC transporter ATP-binding protein [Micromonospora sp. HUAS 3]WDZ83611.1 ABC transporter ATP-binding protein [Micromonospora sp. HUAS 3]
MSLWQVVLLVARAGGASFYGVLATMCTTGIGLAAVLVLGRSLAAGLTRQDGRPGLSLWLLLAAVVLLVAVVAFGRMVGGGLHRLLTEKVIRWCEEQITLLSAHSELIEFDTPAFHDRLVRARRASTSALQITLAVPRVIAASLTVGGLVVAVALTAPVLLPVALLSGLPVLLTGRALGERLLTFTWGHTPSDRERQHIENILESRDQAAEIRVFGIQDFLADRWRHLYDERIDEIRDLVRGFLRRAVVAAVGVAASLTVLLVSLAWLLARGHVDLLAAVTVGVSVLILSNQSQTIAANVGALREHSGQLADFLATMRLLDRLAGTGVDRRPAAGPLTRLDVDQLTFSYPAANRPALSDVSFSLRGDEMVAIVGHNGSGKTTLAKLLCGLYEAQSGEVRWNGRPIRAQDPGNEIGAVFQSFARYWFSAADNIRVGAAVGPVDADLDRVRAAAREAEADGFLAGLPRGYETLLAAELAGGVDLSVGQWQRVAIARVLYRDPSLVVLDEPTASLDAEAEAKLFSTLSRLRGSRAVLVISHRFSTVRVADRILVLDNGRLIEQGTHDELMTLGGKYAGMYSQQAAAYA